MWQYFRDDNTEKLENGARNKVLDIHFKLYSKYLLYWTQEFKNMSMKLWQCFYIEMLLLYFIVLKLYCFTLLEAKRGFELKNVKMSTTGLTILIWERNTNFVNLNDRGDNIFWTLHCRVQECQCQSLKQLCLLMIPEMTIHYTLYINNSNTFNLTSTDDNTELNSLRDIWNAAWNILEFVFKYWALWVFWVYVKQAEYQTFSKVEFQI